MSVLDVSYKMTHSGGVPGGHYALWDTRKARPFVPPMKECHSIPLRHSDVIADIGAYVGTFALYCARFPVKQVVAYEPTPRTREVLQLNKGELPNLRIEEAAVVPDDRREVDLYVSKGIGVTNSVILSRRKAGKITVPAVSYEAAVAGASVVKIDVEGAEYLYPIVQPSLRAVIIDFHPLPKRNWIEAARRIIQELEDAGFTSVVEPDFTNGWTRAGSWMRLMETEGACKSLMNGEQCCGCGKKIRATSKALCQDCWAAWSEKDRTGFERGRS